MGEGRGAAVSVGGGVEEGRTMAEAVGKLAATEAAFVSTEETILP